MGKHLSLQGAAEADGTDTHCLLIVTAKVMAVPQADIPKASEDLICQITSHDNVARPLITTSK